MEPDGLEVVFERFHIVWPEPDEPAWLTENVRELRWDERDWFRTMHARRWDTTEVISDGVVQDVAALPAVVCERGGERIGVATFRPRPGGSTEVVSVDAFVHDADVRTALTAGLVELACPSGWSHLWMVTGDGEAPMEFELAPTAGSSQPDA